ncbi:SAM-dependent methyltransferase [Variovorax boronicumulans]|uniref:SAM-dependent methyltransferase n=1 Tax=Variovorax boronicumulans TaxID=436515 RepID=UPI001F0ADB9A|nr:class I SAM-dependent methyltransferase [Variovorax boronicumulans]
MSTATARRIDAPAPPSLQVIRGAEANPYHAKVEYTYQDDPEDWRKAIGEDLMFQFGVYDDPRSVPPISLNESGLRYFDQQMEIAGLDQPPPFPIRRILDVGCGWGFGLRYLAEHFPQCRQLDGINISETQLAHCARYHAQQHLSDRVNLYLCDAQDVALLPNPDTPYDLVTIRGVISHFPNDLYERSMKQVAARMRPGPRSSSPTTSTTSRWTTTAPTSRTRSTASPASTARHRPTSAACSRRAASWSKTCACSRATSMWRAGSPT